MVFVTVGTHEQPFDRLVECMDRLVESGAIREEVRIQTGYSNFEPKHCFWQRFFPYTEMEKNVDEARIVITHGGPASFIMPLRVGKTPIVVPRRCDFNEHVNNHQVDFARAVAERMKTIIVVEDIEALGSTIERYDEIVGKMKGGLQSNNAKFCAEFESIVDELMKG